MNGTSVRLLAISGLLLLVFGLTLWTRGGLTRDDVMMPLRPLNELPKSLGNWQGEEVELDPRIATATGAEELVNRRYAAPALLPVTLHCAVHVNPETAVIHTPIHCYRGQAYQMLDERRVVISGSGDAAVEASLSTWQLSGRKVRVLYWFQWGEYTFFDRLDLGAVRVRMRGLTQWPAVIKVLLETPATDDEEADERRLVEIGKHAFDWLVANSGLPKPVAE